MKFKAWDGKQWRTNFVIDAEGNVFKTSIDGYVDIVGDDFQDWKVVRSTGLTDRCGVEIWEGDIVRCESVTGTSLYDSCTVYGKVEYSAPYWVIDGAYLWHELDDIEIVGNVFENPELIETSK